MNGFIDTRSTNPLSFNIVMQLQKLDFQFSEGQLQGNCMLLCVNKIFTRKLISEQGPLPEHYI